MSLRWPIKLNKEKPNFLSRKCQEKKINGNIGFVQTKVMNLNISQYRAQFTSVSTIFLFQQIYFFQKMGPIQTGNSIFNPALKLTSGNRVLIE